MPSRPFLKRYCPACSDALGLVTRITTLADRPGVLRITMRCEVCGHNWTYDAAGDSASPDPPAARDRAST